MSGMEDLIAQLERINKLPLTAAERATLMRRLLADGDEAPPKRPGPRGPRAESLASAVRAYLAHGRWEAQHAIRAALQGEARASIGSLSTVLRDLMARGDVERKEDGAWPNGRPMVFYRLVERDNGS